MFLELSKIYNLKLIHFLAQSRRDDVISVGYLLLFLFNGQVPWIKKSNVPLKN